MTSVEGRLLRYIDERLMDMIQAPEMWGANESVELQIIQLLEVRYLVLNPLAQGTRSRQVFHAYVGFLAARFPDDPPEPLSALLARYGREPEFAALLGNFVQAQIAEQGPGPIEPVQPHPARRPFPRYSNIEARP
jgi:hypothetical protein